MIGIQHVQKINVPSVHKNAANFERIGVTPLIRFDLMYTQNTAANNNIAFLPNNAQTISTPSEVEEWRRRLQMERIERIGSERNGTGLLATAIALATRVHLQLRDEQTQEPDAKRSEAKRSEAVDLYVRFSC